MSLAFVDAAVRSGVARPGELRPDSLEGVGLVRVTQRRGLRCSAADNYLAPARRRPNLTVLTDAHVRGVEFAGARATACATSAPARV
jgi:choline dehydrogenase-like flavoprotein